MRENLSNLLDRASGLEMQVADIYERLARQFEGDPTLASFWALFAEAERYHSLIIQMQKLGMTDATASEADIDAWGREIADTHAYLKGIQERLSVQAWKPSISEAFDLAQDIEGKSLEVQARSFALFESPVIKELVARLHQEDMHHRAKLMTAKGRFAAAARST